MVDPKGHQASSPWQMPRAATGKPQPMGRSGAWAADNVATDDQVQDRPEEQREGERLTKSGPKVADEKG